MIDASPRAGEAMMQGLLNRIDGGTGPGRAEMYAGTRPAAGDAPAGALVASVPFAAPAGTVSATTGLLTIAVSGEGQIVSALKPTWARVVDGSGAWLFDADVRDVDDADTGQEFVIQVSEIYLGGFLRIFSGLFGV